jgi:hypothetical protein
MKHRDRYTYSTEGSLGEERWEPLDRVDEGTEFFRHLDGYPQGRLAGAGLADDVQVMAGVLRGDGDRPSYAGVIGVPEDAARCGKQPGGSRCEPRPAGRGGGAGGRGHRPEGRPGRVHPGASAGRMRGADLRHRPQRPARRRRPERPGGLRPGPDRRPRGRGVQADL